MQKIIFYGKIFLAISCVCIFFSSYAEIYRAKSIKELQEITEDIFAKRDSHKTLFIFPLENFILTPSPAAMQKQDESYKSLLKKAFSQVKNTIYAKELMLLDYPHEVSDPALVELVHYIQDKMAGIIITTPNVTGNINKVKFFDQWTVEYLKSKKIDLTKGIFAGTKFILDTGVSKTGGSYPSFYQGLLSCNSDGKNNSAIQVLGALFALKLKIKPTVIVAVSDSRSYLETVEKQFSNLQINNEFFGILYDSGRHAGKSVSPEEYLGFWQNFVRKLGKVTRKEIDLKSDNPYEK